jgi:sulfite reductase (NADPH) flavoprotein alpha-component
MMLQILFGSQSGNARNLANTIAECISNHHISNAVLDMGECDPESIQHMTHLLIVTSTYGDGEAPDNASEWMSYLKFNDELKLSHLHYGVLGLGDTYYPHFCQAGKDFDEYLSKRGAHSLLPRMDCDLYFEEQYRDWLNLLIDTLKKFHSA